MQEIGRQKNEVLRMCGIRSYVWCGNDVSGADQP